MKRFLAYLFLVFAMGCGALSTVYWVRFADWGTLDELPSILTILGATSLTLCYVTLRWVRWRFLIRRLGSVEKLRPEFMLYLRYLAAPLTPFYLAEWMRNARALRHSERAGRKAFALFLGERGTDAVGLFGIYLGFAYAPVVGLALLPVWLCLVFGLASYCHQFDPRHHGIGFTRGSTFLYTALSSLALGATSYGIFFLLCSHLGSPVGAVEGLRVWVGSIFLGPACGIPAGIATSGSYLIDQLGGSPDPGSNTIAGVALYRTLAVWFPIGIGLVTSLLLLRKSTGAETHDVPEHFDSIAEVYDTQIPDHIRIKVLAEKLKYMRPLLNTLTSPSGEPLKGLDIGCGQGWYMEALAKEGHSMAGIDPSEAQVESAKRLLADHRDVSLHATSATTLPVGDNTTDFMYAVNVFHHILEPGDRTKAFAEITRCLKPGGLFFLHEINVTNPVFRIYMSYIFPLLNDIDEGNEAWIDPADLPVVPGATWSTEVAYFTWLPDFVPAWVVRLALPLERALERSPMKRFSAHYMAVLKKDLPE